MNLMFGAAKAGPVACKKRPTIEGDRLPVDGKTSGIDQFLSLQSDHSTIPNDVKREWSRFGNSFQNCIH